jgi:hypothetical protein
MPDADRRTPRRHLLLGEHRAGHPDNAAPAKPMPGMGPKQWSVKLTAAQRETLTALPVPTADRAALDHARDAAISVFLREARLIAATYAVPWPAELEVAVRGYLAAEGFSLGPPFRS